MTRLRDEVDRAIDAEAVVPQGEGSRSRSRADTAAISCIHISAYDVVMSAFDAARWLDEWLRAYPWHEDDDGAGPALVDAAMALPTSARVALHTEAVARLPAMREAADDGFRWKRGSAVYELACHLYEAKLAYTEADVCALLRSSKHSCGHGSDVTPPFELAIAWARRHGVTPAWLDAVRTFVEGLAGLGSVKANTLKVKGGLVLLLDGEGPARRCHSERFRRALPEMPPAERAAWQRLVLHMGAAHGASHAEELRGAGQRPRRFSR
jgi:hypothetical protein